MKQRIPRVIYNDDSCSLRCVPPPHTTEAIKRVVNYLAGTQVDCLCWCIWEDIGIAWPSETANISENNYGGPDWRLDQCAIYSLRRQGIDYLPLLIEEAHKHDLMFTASIRMNDAHIKSHPNNILAPAFWKKHQHYRLWGVNNGKSYYNAALDYSYPEVRKYYYDAIANLIANYDIDGIELDFTRSPYFFQPEEAWNKREILTDFIRDVRNLVNCSGRSLTLLLRVDSRLYALNSAGIDLKEWITEQLPTILIASELNNNYNMQLEPLLSLCHNSGILLYPAVESTPAFNDADFYSLLVSNQNGPGHSGSGGIDFPDDERIKMHRAMAQNILSQKPDGIYIFNFPCWLAEKKNIMYNYPSAFHRITTLLSEMGSLDTLAGRAKRYTFYKELPIFVEANRPRRFHQTIPFIIRGKDIRKSTVTLRFRQISEKNPHTAGTYRQKSIVKPGLLNYYLNDNRIPENKFQKIEVPPGRIPSGFYLKTHEIVELQIPGKELIDGKNILGFEMPHFPQERDPYIYIYALEADVSFTNG